MGIKFVFLGCGLFFYAFAPATLLPAIPGQPQSILILAGLVIAGPLIYNTYR